MTTTMTRTKTRTTANDDGDFQYASVDDDEAGGDDGGFPGDDDDDDDDGDDPASSSSSSSRTLVDRDDEELPFSAEQSDRLSTPGNKIRIRRNTAVDVLAGGGLRGGAAGPMAAGLLGMRRPAWREAVSAATAARSEP